MQRMEEGGKYEGDEGMRRRGDELTGSRVTARLLPVTAPV